MMEQKIDQNGENKAITGLPMFEAADPEAMAEERRCLVKLREQPILRRWRGYFTLTGPGWLQSALTLGSGSAIASLFAGATRQYGLLWVQPIAMLLGLIMLDVISHQTLATGKRPFLVIRKFLHPSIAWLWAFGALAVTMIWHFPQYALAAGMVEDIIQAGTGWKASATMQTVLLIGIGLVILVISTMITWNYGRGYKGIRLYEKILKGMIWMIIITFAIVVVRRTMDGAIEWSRVCKGFLPLDIPKDKRGVSIVVAAFSAVVGINSTFLYPYTLMARGWTKEHRGLSQFDLITGTFLPFCIVTSLVIIAAGCTIYDPKVTDPAMMSPVQAAKVFQAAGLSLFVSRLVFGLGIIAMALSTITVHMLMSGFAACELLGVEPGGWKYKLACLFPVPGFTGVILWKYIGPWIAVPASAICGLILPFAYIIFIVLQNKKEYLGSAKPVGIRSLVWNALMIIALLTSVASAAYYLYSKIIK
ncbi:MAG: divalent metal cation transporter [Planctomycetota bacterium]|jgi:Mn2+/Fe2+ NRAMP family transporter